MICDIDIELWKFRDIYFDEGPHVYTDSLGTQYTSVTRFVKECSEELEWEKYTESYAERNNKSVEDVRKEFESDKYKFCDEEKWCQIAEKYAKKNGRTYESVKAEWDENKDIAARMGTQVHSYMENLWKRKHYQPEIPVGDYEVIRKNGLEAYEYLKRRFVPIRNEFIVYKPEWALCGTIDFLCWDRANDCIAILDWKTNKEIKKDNQFGNKLVGPLNGLPDCNYIHYSAQLSTYKLLIERMTDLRVGTLALVHLKRNGWEYLPCQDFSVEIGAYLGNRALEKKNESI